MKHLIVFLTGLLVSSSCYAETIKLESGKTVEGPIVERTDEYIKVTQDGIDITYFMDEIISIEENSTNDKSQADGAMYTYQGPAHQPKLLNVKGDFIHPSGMIFPPAVEEAKRTMLIQYDADGKDISGGYDLILPSGKLSATVYIYPERPHTPFPDNNSMPKEVASFIMCMQEYGLSKQEAMQTLPGTKLIEEEDVFLSLGGLGYRGRRGAFEMELRMPGQAPLEIMSQLYVFCVDSPWHLKYRFSYLKNMDVTSHISQFFEGLLLTFKKDPNSTPPNAVVLKNGMRVEGQITEETDSYIKIESSGLELTYEVSEIKEIEK